jgi:hypothetical protein
MPSLRLSQACRCNLRLLASGLSSHASRPTVAITLLVPTAPTSKRSEILPGRRIAKTRFAATSLHLKGGESRSRKLSVTLQARSSFAPALPLHSHEAENRARSSSTIGMHFPCPFARHSIFLFRLVTIPTQKALLGLRRAECCNPSKIGCASICRGSSNPRGHGARHPARSDGLSRFPWC